MFISCKSLFSAAVLILLPRVVSACVDSIWFQTSPVHCFGNRDGKIKVSKVFGGKSPYYYSIDGQSFSTNPNFDHLWAGEYNLQVRDADGCVQQFVVEMPEPQEIQLRLQTQDTSVVVGKPVILQALIAPETLSLQSIEWYPLHLFPKQDTLRQKVMIAESTEFSVHLKDKNGCEASNSLVVEVQQPDVYVPNAIKYGSDKNAFLTVYSGEGIREVTALRVYNRSGALLFERQHFPSNDPVRGWNGRYEGQKVPPGVYVWTATVELLDGSLYRFDGSVTVVE